MKRHLYISLICLIIALIAAWHIGCDQQPPRMGQVYSTVTQMRRDGFNLMQNSFASLPSTPDLHKIVRMGNVNIHIVGSAKEFGYIPYRTQVGVAGYATGLDIYVLGTVYKGKIVTNWALIGHEISHYLNFLDPEIVNPDLSEIMGI